MALIGKAHLSQPASASSTLESPGPWVPDPLIVVPALTGLSRPYDDVRQPAIAERRGRRNLSVTVGSGRMTAVAPRSVPAGVAGQASIPQHPQPRLVGAPRFELGTPCTPCKCATRLRHAPTICSEACDRRERGRLARAVMIPRISGDCPLGGAGPAARSMRSARRPANRAPPAHGGFALPAPE